MIEDAVFELAKTPDGEIILMCNLGFPSKVRQVEYYCDAKIFILTFFSPIAGETDHMIQYEVNDKTARLIEERRQETILLVSAANVENVRGYEVPFIKSGTLETT